MDSGVLGAVMSDTIENSGSESAPTPSPVVGMHEILQATPDLAFACDERGTLRWVSRAFGRLTGYPTGQVLGQPALSLVPAAERRSLMRTIVPQWRGETPSREVAVKIVLPSGATLEVLACVRRWERTVGGAIIAGTLRDSRNTAPEEAPADSRPASGAATPAESAEPPADGSRSRPAERGEARERAFEARDVLAAIGGELQVPLNAVMGVARLLMQTNLTDEQRALVDLLARSGDVAHRRINDACELSQAGTGWLDIDHIPFDLRVTVDRAAAALAPLAADRNLTFECSVHPVVPSRVCGDPGRLRQVLLNLAEGVIRTTHSSRVALLVSRLRENDTAVTLRFLVTGQGATRTSPEAANPSPDPGDADRPRGTLLGLGPVVMQRMAELMGGQIGSDVEPGGGGTAWFELEMDKQSEPEGMPGPTLSKTDLATKRALIVDASAATRRTLRSRLEAAGCRASEADGSEEALTLLKRAVELGDPFHFVLIDRDLHGEEGEALGTSIRAEPRLSVARTVLLTTVGRRGDAARAAALGFSAYLPKGLTHEELVDALSEVSQRAMEAAAGERPPLITRYSLAEARRRRTRVLLVGDNPVAHVVTQWCLSRHGYQVEIVESIAAARAAWMQTGYEVVITDELLPDGDALALARTIRAAQGSGPRASIIATLRHVATADQLAWKEAGIDACLDQGVDLEVMTRLVEQMTQTATPPGSEDDGGGSPGQAVSPPASHQGPLEFILPETKRPPSDSELARSMTTAIRASMDSMATGSIAPAVEAGTGGATPGRAPAVAGPADGGPSAEPAVLFHQPSNPARPAADPPAAEPDPGPPLPAPAIVPAPQDGGAPASTPGPSILSGPRDSAIDVATFDEVSMGIASMRRGLLSAYLSESGVLIEKLAHDLADGRAAGILSSARELAALSRGIGAVGLASQLAELERLVNAGTLDEAAVLLRTCRAQATLVEHEAAALLEQVQRAA